MPSPDALPDGPEADLQEQRAEVDPPSTTPLPDRVNRKLEVPEADAIEQAQVVPPPEDERD